MGILCGVDIIEINRIKKIIDSDTGEAFKRKVFTPAEIEYCESRKKSKYQSYAARFAAKEAVSKALGTGISSGISLKDIEVLNHDCGKPYVVLKGRAQKILERLKGKSISVSLSHSDSDSIAFVVIETL